MMNEPLYAKYLGSFGGGYKFENDSNEVIIFKRCSMDFVREFGLWTEMSVNQFFNIEYGYFNKYTMVINDLTLI